VLQQTVHNASVYSAVATRFMYVVCLFLAQQSPVGQGLLIHEVSRSHTMTHHSQ